MSDEEAANLASTNAAAASAVSALRMITEEMLNKTTNQLKLVASETPTLKQEEAEVFLSLLTTPFLAVPLLLEFFADGRVRALQDAELQTCLELALYQLHPFRTAPSSAVGSKKWDAERICAENIEFSSRDGALLHEVRTTAVGKSRRRRVEASRVTAYSGSITRDGRNNTTDRHRHPLCRAVAHSRSRHSFHCVSSLPSPRVLLVPCVPSPR